MILFNLPVILKITTNLVSSIFAFPSETINLKLHYLYRKPTFTGLGMNFKSFVPRSFKINLISCLVLRAFEICSEKLSFERELEHPKSFFLSNNFPCKFVENSLIRTLRSTYNCNPPPPSHSYCAEKRCVHLFALFSKL